MSEQQCSMYYPCQGKFNFNQTCMILKQKGIAIENHETKSVVAIDEQGNKYLTNLRKLNEKIAKNNAIHLLIKPKNSRSNVLWRTRIDNNFLIYDFYFEYLEYSEINSFLKILWFLFNQSLQIEDNSSGMFIDKYGTSSDFDFDLFFIGYQSKICYIPEIVCLQKDKLKSIDTKQEYIVYELDKNFVCVSKDKSFSKLLVADNK